MKIDPETVQKIIFVKNFCQVLLLALGLGIITFAIETLFRIWGIL